MSIRNYATEAYGTDSVGFLDALPRQRFNFRLRMSLADGGAPIEFLRIQDLTVPGYNFDTQIVNQYNKKRVVQTKLNYGTLTVNFYDTFDNQFHNVLSRYIKNYYNSDLGIDRYVDAGIAESTTVDTAFTIQGLSIANNRYFVPEIEIEQNGIAGNTQYRKTILKNCMLVSVAGDTLSYSDSGAVLWNTQWQPESIQVESVPDRFST